jgi:O-antigen/teichoic acid export membrane protein
LAIGILLFFGSGLISAMVFSKPHLTFYFTLAACFVVFKSLMLLNTQAVRGLRLIRTFAFMITLPQGFNLIFLLLFGLRVSTSDVPVYAQLCAYALTGIFGWAIMEYAFKKKMAPQDSVHPMPAWEILHISLPMLMTAAMSFIIAQTGVIMLGMFRSEAEIGYYAVAVNLSSLAAFVLSAINSMAAPKFSEFFHSGRVDELFYVAKKSSQLIFWATTPILLFLIILGRHVMWILFGKEFVVAYWAMTFLIIGQFINSISGSTGFFMNMTGHQKVFRNIMLTAAILNILLNLVLIPQLGINGVALAGMSCLIFWNISVLLYIKRKYGTTIAYFPLLN